MAKNTHDDAQLPPNVSIRGARQNNLKNVDVDIPRDKLVTAGNTVVIVEHDMRIVAQTDYVIDMGPGAGNLGGTVVAHGTPQEVAKVHDSATAPFLKKAITGKK